MTAKTTLRNVPFDISKYARTPKQTKNEIYNLNIQQLSTVKLGCDTSRKRKNYFLMKILLPNAKTHPQYKAPLK